MPSRRIAPAPRRSWWQRHRDTWLHDLTVALTAGAVVSIPLTALTIWQTGLLADRQEVLENTRFLRDRIADPNGIKPFRGLNLREAQLSGLLLGCPEGSEPRVCADLALADLSDASLFDTDLSGADLGGANLSGANLFDADLSRAELFIVNLTGADLGVADLSDAYLFRTDLSGADLAGANLSGATLDEVNLSGACFSPSPEREGFPPTLWPEGFKPPSEPVCKELLIE